MTPRHFGETHIMLPWTILVYNIDIDINYIKSRIKRRTG